MLFEKLESARIEKESATRQKAEIEILGFPTEPNRWGQRKGCLNQSPYYPQPSIYKLWLSPPFLWRSALERFYGAFSFNFFIQVTLSPSIESERS